MRRRTIAMAVTPGGLRRLVERLRLPLALADQGLVSGASFLFTILLARFLGVEAFGRFTLLWITVLFVNSLQFAAVLQPMMSIGVKQVESEMPAYYGAVICQQLMMSAAAFVALLVGVEVGAIVVPDWGIRSLALPLGVAMFAGQAQDFFRRYLFVRGRPLVALANDGIRYLGQMALLYAVNELSGALTIVMALWVMSAAAMLGTVHGVLCLEKLTLRVDALRKTIRRHWQLARWLIPSMVMSWCTSQVYLLMAGAVLGAATVGVLRAAQTIFGVIDVLVFALDNFMPAHASEIFHRQGSIALHRHLKSLTWKLWSIIVLPLLLLINVNAGIITRLAYGSKYPEMNYLLLGFSIIYLVPVPAKVLHVWALAIESTEVEFIPWIIAVAFTLVTAYPFVVFGGVFGVFSGIFLVSLIWTIATFSKLRKK